MVRLEGRKYSKFWKWFGLFGIFMIIISAWNHYSNPEPIQNKKINSYEEFIIQLGDRFSTIGNLIPDTQLEKAVTQLENEMEVEFSTEEKQELKKHLQAFANRVDLKQLFLNKKELFLTSMGMSEQEFIKKGNSKLPKFESDQMAEKVQRASGRIAACVWDDPVYISDAEKEIESFVIWLKAKRGMQ